MGDAKYKALGSAHAPNADLYQLLAYATALRLPGGLLIYASGEADPTVHYIEHAGKRLEVAALDLAASPPALLGQIRELAERIRGAAAAVRAHAA